MAKKKSTPRHESHPHKQENPPPQDHVQKPTMDDPNEKLQHLKSLNGLLLKETIERRQQVETLVHAKESLEAQLSQFGAVKSELETELARSGEDRVGLEIENGLFCVFVEAQLSEMVAGFGGLVREKMEVEKQVGLLKKEVSGLVVSLESERDGLTRVCKERDVLRGELDKWIEQANGLREKVVEMEKKERVAQEEIGALKVQYGDLIKQKKEKEEEMEEVKRLRDLSEKNLAERVKEIGVLKGEIEGVVRDKNEIQMERNGQRVKIGELEKEVGELSRVVTSLQKEEGVLRGKVLDLEKKCDEAMEKEKVRAKEIDALMEEKREEERTIEGLMEGKTSFENYIMNAEFEMKQKNELIDKLSREKGEIEEDKVCKENEIVELQKELGELRDAVLAVKKSLNDQEKKNKELMCEVSDQRGSLEKVKLERDNAYKSLDEVKKKGSNLRSQVLEMENKIEETGAELGKLKIERENLMKEKNKVQSQVGSLKKEKEYVERSLLETQRERDDLRRKLESAVINSERALTMLKNTAALVCPSKDGKEGAVTEKKLDGEIERFAAELEAIKNAFKNQETLLEEMKQQVQGLHNSVAEAHKKKSFWAAVSSATTIFAAASIAYAARAIH